MTFLVMLSVILLSMLILLSTLNVIRHLICGNNWNWLLWTVAGSDLLISMLEKTYLVLFDWSNNTGAIDVKTDGSVLEEG